MKKYTYLIISILIIGLFSCKKDNTTQPQQSQQAYNPTTWVMDLTKPSTNSWMCLDTIKMYSDTAIDIPIKLDYQMYNGNLSMKFSLVQSTTTTINYKYKRYNYYRNELDSGLVIMSSPTHLTINNYHVVLNSTGMNTYQFANYNKL